MTFRDMMICTAANLRAHYADCRALAYSNAQIAQHLARATARGKAAHSMGYLMRQIEMCERAASRRGISLVVAAEEVA